MSYSIRHIAIGLISGAFGTLLALFVYEKETNAQEPIVMPCKCLTISEVLLHIEKREMFVDKLQICKMSERSAIIDSINFHNALLDSTGNKIEY